MSIPFRYSNSSMVLSITKICKRQIVWMCNVYIFIDNIFVNTLIIGLLDSLMWWRGQLITIFLFQYYYGFVKKGKANIYDRKSQLHIVSIVTSLCDMIHSFSIKISMFIGYSGKLPCDISGLNDWGRYLYDDRFRYKCQMQKYVIQSCYLCSLSIY